MTALDRQAEHLAVVCLQQLVPLRAQHQILELAHFRITINSRVCVTDVSMMQQAVS